jgi:hypothetical protein
MNQTIESKPEMVSFCGLYCGGCRSYLKGKCPGCAGNAKATWCKVRKCCMEKGIKSCADCTEFINPMECKKFNNFVSKVFAFVFRSDRAASIDMIKKIGYEGFTQHCLDNNIMVIRKQ